MNTMEVMEGAGMMWVLSAERADTIENVGMGEGGHRMIVLASGMTTDVIIATHLLLSNYYCATTSPPYISPFFACRHHPMPIICHPLLLVVDCHSCHTIHRPLLMALRS
jgi:hypothetical protein